jgi:hypothetical protein
MLSSYTVTSQLMATVTGPQWVALGGFTPVPTFGVLNPTYAGDDARQALREASVGFSR